MDTEPLRTMEQRLEAIQAHTWSQREVGLAHLLASLAQSERGRDPLRLTRHYSQVYSQHCEDGYIAEIFSRIGEKKRTFLEIGVGDGTQNTTRFLLETGWQGVWVEGDEAHFRAATEKFSDFISDGSLKVINLMVTSENINAELNSHGVAQEFDYIGVDVDQNTSHIWRALDQTSRVACIEHNSSIPPTIAIEVPYQDDAVWDGTNFFGASLKTMELIGKAKGMSLVGCDFAGINAYFVSNNERLDHFSAPFTAENHYESPKYNVLSHIGHPPSQQGRKWASPAEMNQTV